MSRLFPYIHTADPAAHVFSDGRLWLYADRDPARQSDWWGAMCSYHAFCTDNLLDWIDHGSVLSCEDIAWRDGAAWDGDCVEANGKYYYYFPMIDQIGVAVSDQPRGPFIDALGRPLITRSTPGILPRTANGGFLVSPVVVSGPCGIFLYFGQCDELYIAELDQSMTELKGPVRKLRGLPQDYHEGPWVFYRSGLYHMIYGRGPLAEAADQQSDDLAYASSPRPDGPFTFQNVVQADKGRTVQACLVEWHDKDIFFYHEDGPDNYHRHLRAEVVTREPGGGVGLIPRSSSPLVVRSVALSAEGRHYAEDFHASTGFVERVLWPEKNMGFVRLGGRGASIEFHNIRALESVELLHLRTRTPKEGGANLEVGARGAGAHTVGVPHAVGWCRVVVDLAIPHGGYLPQLVFRNPGDFPIEILDFRFERCL